MYLTLYIFFLTFFSTHLTLFSDIRILFFELIYIFNIICIHYYLESNSASKMCIDYHEIVYYTFKIY